MSAKEYKCPKCDRTYVTEVSKPICPDCSSRETGKVYLEEK
jgi:hypothetical protein